MASATVVAGTGAAPVRIALRPLVPGNAAAIEFAGVGALLEMKSDTLTVTKVLDSGPAAVAGILAGYIRSA